MSSTFNRLGFVLNWFCDGNGSGVELRILDYENPGSNPMRRCSNFGQDFSLYIDPVV